MQGWREIKAEVSRRINAREWPPGSLLPAETTLANEFGCARATVNRALRELAEAGLLVRRRRAGTVVAEHPVRKASFDIPVIRLEVEQAGRRYAHRVLHRLHETPPASVRTLFGLVATARAIKLDTLHLADDMPYAWETRWINTKAVPDARQQDFEAVSANEWLVRNAPFSGGRYTVGARLAGAELSAVLNCGSGEPLVVVERNTVDLDGLGITQVQLVYAPGHLLRGGI